MLRDAGGGNKQLFGGNTSGVGPEKRGNDTIALLTLKEFVHTLEGSTNVEPAYALDRRRLEGTLGRLGKVDFSHGKTARNEGVASLTRTAPPTRAATRRGP